MVTIKKVEDIKIIEILKPFFIEDGAYTRDIIAKELYELMSIAPKSVFICVIFKNSNLCGFGVASVPFNRSFVNLDQAWVSPDIKKRHSRKVLEMIKQWAFVEYNIHEIRFETERNPEAIARAWGFSIHSYIMKSEF